jgi:hypothetical protein
MLLERPLELGDEVVFKGRIIYIERVTRTRAYLNVEGSRSWEYEFNRSTGKSIGYSPPDVLRLATDADREAQRQRELKEAKDQEQMAKELADNNERLRLSTRLAHLTIVCPLDALQRAVELIEQAALGGQRC